MPIPQKKFSDEAQGQIYRVQVWPDVVCLVRDNGIDADTLVVSAPIWSRLVLFVDQSRTCLQDIAESFAAWYDDNVDYLGEDARDDVRAAYLAGSRVPWTKLAEDLAKIGDLVNQGLPPERHVTDIHKVLEALRGILQQSRNVRISVRSGVVDVESADPGVRVEVRDYDVEGIEAEEERYKDDDDGDTYVESIYEFPQGDTHAT